MDMTRCTVKVRTCANYVKNKLEAKNKKVLVGPELDLFKRPLLSQTPLQKGRPTNLILKLVRKKGPN